MGGKSMESVDILMYFHEGCGDAKKKGGREMQIHGTIFNQFGNKTNKM